MAYDPAVHHRRSIRLRGYDYAQAGAYFVTICTAGRACILGEIVDDQIALSPAGEIVARVWDGLPTHYPFLELDEFVVMPNHVHGIVILSETDPEGAGLKPAPTHPLSEIVRGFKTYSSRLINELREVRGQPVWQRGYFEHVIRNERSLNEIRRYIAENPARWAFDHENPQRRP